MSAAAASGAAAAAEDDALTVAGGVCIECGGMELLTACMQGAWHHHLGGGEREREGESGHCCGQAVSVRCEYSGQLALAVGNCALTITCTVAVGCGGSTHAAAGRARRGGG
jgi:hypothetical protein